MLPPNYSSFKIAHYLYSFHHLIPYAFVFMFFLLLFLPNFPADKRHRSCQRAEKVFSLCHILSIAHVCIRTQALITSGPLCALAAGHFLTKHGEIISQLHSCFYNLCKDFRTTLNSSKPFTLVLNCRGFMQLP